MTDYERFLKTRLDYLNAKLTIVLWLLGATNVLLVIAVATDLL